MNYLISVVIHKQKGNRASCARMNKGNILQVAILSCKVKATLQISHLRAMHQPWCMGMLARRLYCWFDHRRRLYCWLHQSDTTQITTRSQHKPTLRGEILCNIPC